MTSPQKLAASACTILVYDSLLINQLMVSQFLAASFQVINVARLVEIESILQTTKVNLIIAELSDGDGKFWKNLSSHYAPVPPVIGLTSFPVYDGRLEEAGVVACITKPVDLGELLELINKHVECEKADCDKMCVTRLKTGTATVSES